MRLSPRSGRCMSLIYALLDSQALCYAPANFDLSLVNAEHSMSEGRDHEVTSLLQAWSAGDEQALAKLAPLVYDELHRTAHRYMGRENTGHTLQTTALVNEVYLRLVNVQKVDWQGRAHFYAICARMMRRVLTDFARSRRYLKRGGDAIHVPFEEALFPGREDHPDIVDLDDALDVLAVMDQRKTQVVELRFFGGFSVEETAKVLDVSVETVYRDWKLAKVWLMRELSKENRHET
jgi:RNA polymerase sigma-70 factor, ECF subfamily